METFTRKQMKKAIEDKLRLNFGCTVEEASEANVMKACAMVLRDVMASRAIDTRSATKKGRKRQVHYMSLEFLMGRSLMKNAYNLECLDALKGALEDLGFKSGDIFEMEPDAGLGNGGLGRLAACYLDSLTTLEIPATGYYICYELESSSRRSWTASRWSCPTTGRGWETPGWCPSPMKWRRSTSAVPSGSSGTTVTSMW